MICEVKQGWKIVKFELQKMVKYFKNIMLSEVKQKKIMEKLDNCVFPILVLKLGEFI